MRIRCKPWAKPELDKCSFCIDTPEELKGKWQKEFNNGKPIYLELGCGKGGFISKAASENRQKNFIAVDIKNEMLVLAKRKIEDEYKRKNLHLNNVRIFIKNIEQIDNIFCSEDNIERIYINFCNPWPKSKHKKRRLTHYRQLVKYKQFLNGEIWFKTDDDALFKESFEYFKQAGYKIKYKTYDLHESGFEENIVTEHEQMFTDEGKKIKFLIAEPESKDNGAEEFMSSSVRELIVDGNTADKENIFKGIGITAKGSAIQKLMDYKIKYPDAYKEIIELFFKPYYGAGISHIKIESGEGSVFSADAVKVNPDITPAFVKENTIKNNSEASAIDIVGRFIKNCCDIELDTEYYDLEQLVKAEQPWSGYYETADGLWAAAHITHFIGNDWKHIKSFSAKKGTHAAFMSDSGDYTLVFVNNTDDEILYNINIINTEKADSVLYCVESVKTDGSVIGGSQWFRVIDKIIPAKNKSGCFYRIDVKPHSILTCTTMGVEDVDGINSVKSSASLSKSLELPYNDSFNYSEEFLMTRHRMPIYTAGHRGKFDIRDFENENVLEHISDNDCLKENILCLGDKYWSNYCAKAEVMLENISEECYAGIGVRCAESENGEYINGCELRLYSDGKWQLRCLNEISAEGKVGEIDVKEWNQLKISVKRNIVVCCVNKQSICNYKMSEPVILAGYVSLNSSEHGNKFRKLSVNSMSGVPCSCVYNDIFESNVKFGEGWKKCKNSIQNEMKNAEFEFDFYGGSVALVGKSEDLRFKAEIDGKIAAAGFPIEKCSQNQAFYCESGLSEKNHNVKVTVLSGKLSFSGIITDEKRTPEKKIKRAAGKKEADIPKGNIKKSTLLIGTGLAAAGIGVLIFNKLFGKKKK